MLDSMTRRQFNESYAAWMLDGFDDSWDQAGTIAAAVVNAIKLHAFGGGKVEEKDLKEAEDFRVMTLGGKRIKAKRKQRRAKMMTSDEMQSAAMRSMGVS